MGFYESLEESCVRIGVDYEPKRERIERALGGGTITSFYIPRSLNPKEEEVEPLLDCALILDSQHFGGLTLKKNKDVELSLFRLTDLVYLTFLYSKDALEVRFGFLGFHEYALVDELGREQEVLHFVDQVKELARTFRVVTDQAPADKTETAERSSI
jgi:hypothetical protein